MRTLKIIKIKESSHRAF